MSNKKIVCIESPFAGDEERNLRYLRERQLGITAGFEFKTVADLTVVYTDLGTSKGMEYGIQAAHAVSCPVEYRTLKGWA